LELCNTKGDFMTRLTDDKIRNAAVAVGVTAVQAALQVQTGQRKSLVITNTSTSGQIITIATGEQAVTSLAGIVLYPGGSWSESLDSAYVPSNLEYWAISSAASGTIAIQERIIPRL